MLTPDSATTAISSEFMDRFRWNKARSDLENIMDTAMTSILDVMDIMDVMASYNSETISAIALYLVLHYIRYSTISGGAL